MDTPTRLVLVRHGESRAVVDRVMAGVRSCAGLTERGREQAAALRDRWASTGEVVPDVVLVSAMRRAAETAEIVVPAFGVDHPLVVDCDVCEIHLGECDGMGWEEYDAQYGFDAQADPERPLGPGAESLASFQRRVSAAADRIVGEYSGRTVVIFCHGGFIGGTTLHLMGQPGFDVDRPWRMYIENTAITEWVGEQAGIWRLERLNDAAHLGAVHIRPGATAQPSGPPSADSDPPS